MQPSLRAAAASNYQYYGDYGGLDCAARQLEAPPDDPVGVIAASNQIFHLPLQSSSTTSHSAIRDDMVVPCGRLRQQHQQMIGGAVPSQQQQSTTCYNERLIGDGSAPNEHSRPIAYGHQQSESQYQLLGQPNDNQHQQPYGQHDNNPVSFGDSIYLAQAAGSVSAGCEQAFTVARPQATNHSYDQQTTVYYELNGFPARCVHETIQHQHQHQQQPINQELISVFQASHHDSVADNAYFHQQNYHQTVNGKPPQYDHYQQKLESSLQQTIIAPGEHQHLQRQYQQSKTSLDQLVGGEQQQQKFSYLEPTIPASSALELANSQQQLYEYYNHSTHHHPQFEPIKADYHQSRQQEQVICYPSAGSTGSSLRNSTQESLSSAASNASDEREDEEEPHDEEEDDDDDDDEFSEESSSIASSLTRDEKRAREANIPLSYGEIVNLSIDQFNEQLAKHNLSETQLTLIKDIRRRGKNKVAAQSCRKRKMEQIYELQQEVIDLASRRRALSCEYAQFVKEHGNLVHEYDRIYSIIQGRMLLD